MGNFANVLGLVILLVIFSNGHVHIMSHVLLHEASSDWQWLSAVHSGPSVGVGRDPAIPKDHVSPGATQIRETKISSVSQNVRANAPRGAPACRLKIRVSNADYIMHRGRSSRNKIKDQLLHCPVLNPFSRSPAAAPVMAVWACSITLRCYT